jgi:hypothetical protein
MSKQEHLVAKRLANVLVANAQALVFGHTKHVIKGFRTYYGGLWVGGTIYLTMDTLIFRPNSFNRLVHKGDMRRTVRLRDIATVEDRRGWFTNIVDVHVRGDPKLTFRCFGAARFSKAIRDQASRIQTQ